MTRTGQPGPDELRNRTSELFERYIHGLAGPIRSGSGVPELFRRLVKPDHPVLASRSLKRLQRALDPGLSLEKGLDRYFRWCRASFAGTEIPSSRFQEVLKSADHTNGMVLFAADCVRRMGALEKASAEQLALFDVIERRCLESGTAATEHPDPVHRRVEEVLFVTWTVNLVVQGILDARREFRRSVFLSLLPWAPRLLEGGSSIEPSRHVWVEGALISRVRQLGHSMTTTRSARIEAVAANLVPEDPPVERVSRSVGRLLGSPAIDGITTSDDSSCMSADAMALLLGWSDDLPPLAMVLSSVELLDAVQRELLAEGAPAEDVVAAFSSWQARYTGFQNELNTAFVDRAIGPGSSRARRAA